MSVTAKKQLFNVVSRSVLCFAAQIWGFKEYESVEKLKKFYFKRILAFPMNTPGYVIYNEAGKSPLFHITLRLHCDYILKVLKMRDKRLTKFSAEVIINKNIFCYKKKMELMNRVGGRYDIRINHTKKNWEREFNELQFNVAICL